MSGTLYLIWKNLNTSTVLLQDNLKEYKYYQTVNKAMEKEIEKYKNDVYTAEKQYTELSNINKHLQDKILNNNEMIAFYKENNHILTESNSLLNKEKEHIQAKADDDLN